MGDLERISLLERKVEALIALLRDALQCDCSVKERESGHRIGCHFTETEYELSEIDHMA